MSLKEITDLAKACSEPICKVIDYTLGPISKPIEKILMAGADCHISNMQKRNESGLKKSELLALKRESFFAEQKQKNMANILKEAIPNMNTSEERINSIPIDFFMNYREKASLASNEDLQHLWANILSGEVNKPGSFSLLTLNTLSLIDKDTALSIEDLFKYAICIKNINNGRNFKEICFVYPEDKVYSDKIFELEALGLIKFQVGDTWQSLNSMDSSYFNLTIFDRNLKLSSPYEVTDFEFDEGPIGLLKTGYEIFSLFNYPYDEAIFNQIKEKLEEKYIVEIID